MKNLFREVSRYGIASAIALLVDASMLWLLVSVCSLDYLLAASISFLCGATVAYAVSAKWAFSHHRLSSQRAEFVSFVAIGLPGLAINAGVISMAVEIFGLHYLVAKGMAAGVTFGFNFFVRRQLLFLKRQTTS